MNLRAQAMRDARTAAAIIQIATTQTSQQRTARRIANQLACIHGIPLTSAALVPWLTDIPVATNLDALVQWVRTQLVDSATYAAHRTDRGVTAALSDRLHRLLASIENACAW